MYVYTVHGTYRCQNVNRQAKQDGSTRKRPKLDGRGVHFYPPIHADDDVAYGRNLELLRAETGKANPRSEVMKDLMRRTFPNRWNGYVVSGEPSTLVEYLSDFPLLKKATYVSKVTCVQMYAALHMLCLHTLYNSQKHRLVWSLLWCVRRKIFGILLRNNFLCGPR